MYDWPQLRQSHDTFWSAIHASLARRGIRSPSGLTHTGSCANTWTRADLVFSQTCGLPFRTRLHGRVHLVGTPDYAVQGCPPGYYRSHLVVRQDDWRHTLGDYRHAVFAYNAPDSQSGYAAALHHAKKHGIHFGNRIQTGGHRASAEAVAHHKADIAAIDAVSWRMIKRFDTCAPALRVLESTVPTPGLPYITAGCQDAQGIFDAVREAIDTLDSRVLTDLTLNAVVRIPADAYLRVHTPPCDCDARLAPAGSEP